MNHNETKVIVQKLLDGSITNDEYKALRKLMNNPNTASEIREILEEVGKEVESVKYGLVFKDDKGN